MSKIKIKNVLIVFLLSAVMLNNTYTMEQENYPKEAKWVALVGGVLIGAIALKTFLSYIDKEKKAQPIEGYQPSSFMDAPHFMNLPYEDQEIILSFLFQNSSAKSLTEEAKTINSLAQVNKELNEYINSDIFCVNIIEHLAKKFDCGELTVAKELRTKKAAQIELLIFCTAVDGIDQNINVNVELQKMKQANIDVNYIYSQEELKLAYRNLGKLQSATPLMLIAALPKRMETDHFLQPVFNFIRQNNAQVNKPNNEGITPLMFACGAQAITGNQNWYTVDWGFNQLITTRLVNVNQQDANGNTALIYAILSQSNINIIKKLIDYGAQVNITNKEGKTALQILKGNQQLYSWSPEARNTIEQLLTS